MTLARTSIRGSTCRSVSAALAAIAIFASPALAADRTVLIEDFNATWCGPCVPIGNIMSSLYSQDPQHFALVQVHINDIYELASAWDDNRLTYYGSNALPTCMFDGKFRRIGSGWSQAQLAEIYQDRRDTPTDVVVTISAAQVAGATYNVSADVSIEANGAGKTMNVYLAYVLDHYPAGSHYRNALMQVIGPTSVSLAPGGSQTVASNITFDGVSMTRTSDIRIVAWAQAPGAAWVQGTDNTVVWNADIREFPFLPDPLPGDLDRDNDVDLADMTLMLSNFGLASGGTWEQGDLDGNGSVNLSDLAILLAHFGDTQ